MNQSTYEDIFRFSVLKPVQKTGARIYLSPSKGFITKMLKLNVQDRINFATSKILSIASENSVVAELQAYDAIRQIYDQIKSEQLDSKTTISEFIQAANLQANLKLVKKDLEVLSDLLLAHFYSSSPKNSNVYPFHEVYNVYFLISNREKFTDSSVLIIEYLNLPLIVPDSLTFAGSTVVEVPGLPNKEIKVAGVKDLMVVKRQIVRYEASEIGHIENIMGKETRNREHRILNRFEGETTKESERTIENEKEYEASERFELSREASKTIANDQKFGSELSLSASYGPSIEFSSKLTFESNQSKEEVARSASKYAKDILERSLERVSERVLERRIQKVVQEVQEINTHGFVNDGHEHISGIYQFIDKIYCSQVFNYGKRAMLDFMIPEPASYLWDLLNGREPSSMSAELTPPPEFNISPLDIQDTDSASDLFYMNLAKKYQTSGIEAPPTKTITVYAKYDNAPADKVLSESGKPKRSTTIELDIPENYIPNSLTISGIGFTDTAHSSVRIVYAIKNQKGVWQTSDPSVNFEDLRGSWNAVYGHESVQITETEIHGERKLFLNIASWETANFSLNVSLECTRSETIYDSWRLNTFNQLLNGFRDLELEYERKLVEQKATEESPNMNTVELGTPPSQKEQIIRTELKKHAISIFTQQWYDEFEVYDESTTPRKFSIDRARILGNFIRFFEQAFEWNHIQYAFYPYFWANKKSWGDRFLKVDSDYNYQQFLQAGSARVVLPIRPGFVKSLFHYFDTGKIWDGLDALPRIGSQVHLDIIAELREQDGVDEFPPMPVGDPWEVRVPSTLVKLKSNSSLPEWERKEGAWDWKIKEQ